MTFMNSDPKIYDKMQMSGDIDKWASQDFITILQACEVGNMKWDPIRMQLRVMGEPHLMYNTPWIHSKGAPWKHCGLDHHTMFNKFGIIHPRCQNCWKVCVTIPTFDKLIKMENMQQLPEWRTRAGKCGMEMRDYTPKFYGAYFYNNSIDEGRDTYHDVVDAVEKYVGHVSKEKDDVNVILKRGCTEFEMIKGPSPFWHNTVAEEDMIKNIEAYVSLPNMQAHQDQMVKNHIRLTWVMWAHMNGDMSYIPYNGGHKLFPDYVHYEDGSLDDIKRDLAVGKAFAMNGMPPETTAKFLALAEQFKIDEGLESLYHLVQAFGVNEDPLKLSTQLEKIVPENKGDLDEISG